MSGKTDCTGLTESVPSCMTPSEFSDRVAKLTGNASGRLVFEKCVCGSTVVLAIKTSGYGGYTASVEMRQGDSRHTEPGGEIKDITVAAGCELYAWPDPHDACDTMQKALISPNGQDLSLCTLSGLLSGYRAFADGMKANSQDVKEIR